jgi:hypothetical protein
MSALLIKRKNNAVTQLVNKNPVHIYCGRGFFITYEREELTNQGFQRVNYRRCKNGDQESIQGE